MQAQTLYEMIDDIFTGNWMPPKQTSIPTASSLYTHTDAYRKAVRSCNLWCELHPHSKMHGYGPGKVPQQESEKNQPEHAGLQSTPIQCRKIFYNKRRVLPGCSGIRLHGTEDLQTLDFHAPRSGTHRIGLRSLQKTAVWSKAQDIWHPDPVAVWRWIGDCQSPSSRVDDLPDIDIQPACLPWHQDPAGTKMHWPVHLFFCWRLIRVLFDTSMKGLNSPCILILSYIFIDSKDWLFAVRILKSDFFLKILQLDF